jgi:hypothetical protein
MLSPIKLPMKFPLNLHAITATALSGVLAITTLASVGCDSGMPADYASIGLESIRKLDLT